MRSFIRIHPVILGDMPRTHTHTHTHTEGHSNSLSARLTMVLGRNCTNVSGQQVWNNPQYLIRNDQRLQEDNPRVEFA